MNPTSDAGDEREERRRLAVSLLNHVYGNAPHLPLDEHITATHVQHDPTMAEGIDGWRDLAARRRAQVPRGTFDVTRTIVDGDLVFVHGHERPGPSDLGSARAHLFRFEGAAVAEHWAAAQPVPEHTTSGNDMFSDLVAGTDPTSDGVAEANRRLVHSFFERLFTDKDVSVYDTMVTAGHRHHNPLFPDGRDVVRDALRAYFGTVPDLTATNLHVLAERDLVVVHAHFVPTPGERGQVIFDVFRVTDSSISEHWDVIADIPATAMNQNGVV